MAIDSHIGNLRHYTVHQIIPQLRLSLRPLFHRVHGNLHGLSKADDARYILGTAAALPLLGAAMHEGTGLDAGTDI